VTPSLLLFAVGGLLLVTGLLGGGLELRELKIPQVGRVVRVLATCVGAVCIVLGAGMSTNIDAPAVDGGAAVRDAPSTTPSGDTAPVRFTVLDELGDGQVSEQVTVIVDGRNVGNLTVNQDYTESQLSVSVPDHGRHDYTLDVSTLEDDGSGAVVEKDAAGQGTIAIEPGDRYEVEYADGGDSRNVTLVAI
jgi:hypothetical protein